MSSHSTVPLMFGALIGFLALGTGTFGAKVVVAPPITISQVAGSAVSIPLTLGNVSANATFTWKVNGASVATLTYMDGKLTANTTSSGYDVSAGNDTMYDIDMTLTINNAMANQNNVTMTGDGVSVNTTLTISATCGASPISGSCMTFKCKANSTTFRSSVGIGNKLYDCYNTTECMANGMWSTVTTMCGSTVVGCKSPMWGANCDMTCGAGCPVSGMCHFTSGICLNATGAIVSGCMGGYTGELCNIVVCMNKTWGATCNMACGAGCYYNCDKTSGQCLNENGTALMTSCKPGYMGAICDQVGCQIAGMWGTNCYKTCGAGCPNNICRFSDGMCLNNVTNATTTACLTGYVGQKCDQPVCSGGCNGGVCLEPNYCGNCPTHFSQLRTSTGVTCRNIRLDGFLKGSLPTFAVLTVVVVLLTVTSKWYIRRKIKQT